MMTLDAIRPETTVGVCPFPRRMAQAREIILRLCA
jgi:hypothetical protein